MFSSLLICHPMIKPLKDLYSVINRFELPKELQSYYDFVGDDKFSLEGDLYKLKKLLLRYKSKSKAEEINTCLFLAILGYYIGEYKLTLYFIRKLEKEEITQIQIRLILDLKYYIRKLDKIIVLTSVEATSLRSLTKVERYVNRGLPPKCKRLVIKPLDELKLKDLKAYFKNYEQVFLVGHGDDKIIEIGGFSLEAHHIIPLLQNQYDKPNVLGIFSCENAFGIPSIRKNVDYFITDNAISAPVFIEMFLYGYLRNFYDFYSIQRAYDAGRILPTIRAVKDVSILLYERGVKIGP